MVNTHRTNYRLSINCLLALLVFYGIPNLGGEGVKDHNSTRLWQDAEFNPSPSQRHERPSLVTELQFTEKNAFFIELPELNREIGYQVKRSQNERPYKVGVHRDIPIHFKGNLVPQIDWHSRDEGYVGSIVIQSPEAKRVRVSISLDLPPKSQITIYEVSHSGNAGNPVNVPVPEHSGSPHSMWLPVVYGEQTAIRFYLPTLLNSSIRIDQISHHFRSEQQSGSFELDGCSNQQNAMCVVDESNNGSSVATGLLHFEKDDGSYTCTGTQMNDKTPDSFIPFLLTAKHCIEDQETADTLEVIWYHRTDDCDTKSLDSDRTTSSSGAYLLEVSPTQDISLLKLKAVNEGSSWAAGWSFRESEIEPGNEVYTFHHPLGQEQKVASGEIDRLVDVQSCDEDEDDCILVRDSVRVIWGNGTTEPGSSGGPLFVNERLVGVLSSGDDECEDSESSYSALNKTRYEISDWLASEVNDDHGDSADMATPIGRVSITPGIFEKSDDLDYFRILVHNAGELTLYTESEIDTRARLINRISKDEWDDDDSGEGLNFKIEQHVETGLYYVEVRAYDGSSLDDNAYRLFAEFKLSDIGDRWQDSYWVYSYPFYLPIALETESDSDWFTLLVTEKGTLGVTTFGTTDTRCSVLPTRSSGIKPSHDDDSGFGSNCEIEKTVVPGIYYVEVNGQDDTVTGEYALAVRFFIEDDHSNDMEFATEVGSTSDNWLFSTHAHLDVDDKDFFKINVEFRGNLEISTDGALDLTGLLLDTDGEEIIFNDDSGVDKNFSFNQKVDPGVYFLKVQGFFEYTEGYYSLAIGFEQTFDTPSAGSAVSEAAHHDQVRFQATTEH